MADGPLGRLFWRTLDALDYWLTQVQLWLVEMRCADLNPRRRLRMSGTIHSLIQMGAAENGRLPSTPHPFGSAGLFHRQASPNLTHRQSVECPEPGNPQLLPPDGLGIGAGGGIPLMGGWRPH